MEKGSGRLRWSAGASLCGDADPLIVGSGTVLLTTPQAVNYYSSVLCGSVSSNRRTSGTSRFGGRRGRLSSAKVRWFGGWPRFCCRGGVNEIPNEVGNWFLLPVKCYFIILGLRF